MNNDDFTLTFEQRPLLLSPMGGRFTQVSLYTSLCFSLISGVKEDIAGKPKLSKNYNAANTVIY